MRRFRRIMSRTADAICIVLMVLTVVMFVRGLWRIEGVAYKTAYLYMYAGCEGGRLHVGIADIPPRASGVLLTGFFSSDVGDFRPPKFWFQYEALPGPTSQTVYIPLWFLFLLFAIKPTWSLIAWRRRRRRDMPGHPLCNNCGYDLHGNTTDSCPECGARTGSKV